MKPCRRRLGPELYARWLGHLCGLCLTLRDTAGQPARVLTGYDVLLVPILIEAQTGRLPTTTAGACPLRGFRTAEVVDSATSAMQAGAAVALLAGSAGLSDKVDDGDAPVLLRPMAVRSAQRLARMGAAAAVGCGLDGADVTAVASRAKAVESRTGASLDQLLEPAGTAVAAMFAHTAVAAGLPANDPVLRRAGDAFGRLVHLVDATEDRESDIRHGRFNPLDATGTTDGDAGELARSLHRTIGRSLEQLHFVDGALAETLLGPTLGASIDRVWGSDGAASVPPPRRRGGALVGVAVAVMAQAAIWGGGRRRNGPYGYDPYGGGRSYYGGRGYGRRRGCGGMGCGELLACDCCANCACDECCGGDDCCCCCI